MTSEYDFETVYGEYFQRITRYLSRIVGADDAEDAAQDVFDRVSRSLSSFRGESQLSTWIYRIATNVAIDRLRSPSYKHSAEQKAYEDATVIKELNAGISQQPTATEQAVIQKEMTSCIQEFIAKLPPDYKAVIVLSELEGLTNREIAHVLEISTDNVKIRLHRARAKLKAALDEGCDFYHTEQNVMACDRKLPRKIPVMPKSDKPGV